MAGEATGPSPFFADLTVEVPRGDVVAAAALTGFSMGVWEHQPGTAAVFLREYAQYDASGKAQVVDVSPDPANGVFAISDCFFVRFRMTVQQGHAFGVADGGQVDRRRPGHQQPGLRVERGGLTFVQGDAPCRAAGGDQLTDGRR